MRCKLKNFVPPYTLESVNTIDDSDHSPDEEYLVDFYDSKVYMRHLTPMQRHRKRVLYYHDQNYHHPKWNNGMNYHYRKWTFGDKSKYVREDEMEGLQAV